MEQNRVYFFDTTLRDGEQTPGVSLQTPEKIEIAKGLVRLGIDVIEAGFPAASPGDFEAVQTIAREVKGATICALARANEKDVQKAIDALKDAERSRLHVFIAISELHMEYKLKMTRQEVLDKVKSVLAYAKGKVDEIEFSGEDAARSDLDFACQVFGVAIAGGATIINVPDTVGYMNPNEFGDKIRYIKEHTSGIENAIISVHCHDDLGLANANTLAAIKAGARQVEGTINGLGERAGNVAIEEVVMALKTRHDYFDDLQVNIDTKQFTKVSKLVSRLTGVVVPPNKAIVGSNAFAHESGIHQHGMMSTEEKINDLFGKFKELADRKKQVYDDDIVALVVDNLHHKKAFELVAQYYKLGEKGYAYADVRLMTPEGEKADAAVGDGPVDASLKAVERVVGLPISLKDYQIRAITAGKDALGEATLKVEYNGRLYHGRGISTDIVKSSVNAYINAVNSVFLAMELEQQEEE
ncbi:MAG: 2-isopropylmalate synthase [Veillonella sp.]|uniref:2-isopropylmalate synthase n=1 Tax=Veillonella sp. TaxID=1926307 RepID=UPI0029133855|nr:2-isopropylmalate synthase [Veillonella sp.]MDU3384482.1 2-isopropylmalate synthase [Veillonella sp.]